MFYQLEYAMDQPPSVQYMDVVPPALWDQGLSYHERRVVYVTNQKVAASETIDGVMGFIFDTTRKMLPCDRLGLAFVDEDGKSTIAVAHWAKASYDPLLLDKGYAEDLRGSSLEAILQSGRPRIINDLAEYLEQHPRSLSTRLILREGIRSSLTTPLTVEGRNVGLLFHSSRTPNRYNDHMVRITQSLVERLSQAVDKARRIEQLTASNRSYTEMLSFITHELRSPLAGLVMDGETLAGDYLGPLVPLQREKVKAMIGKSKYLLGLIRDYLNLAQIDGGQLAAHIKAGTDLIAEVINPAVELAQSDIDDKGMQLEVDLPEGPVLVECDPNMMQVALLNLLGNAVKYGREKGSIRLRVQWQETHLVLRVWNEGPGFPQSEIQNLFRGSRACKRPSSSSSAAREWGFTMPPASCNCTADASGRNPSVANGPNSSWKYRNLLPRQNNGIAHSSSG